MHLKKKIQPWPRYKFWFSFYLISPDLNSYFVSSKILFITLNSDNPSRILCQMTHVFKMMRHDAYVMTRWIQRATWEVVRIQVVSAGLLEIKNIREKGQKQFYSTNMINPSGDHWSSSTIIFNWHPVFCLFRSGFQSITWKIKFSHHICLQFDRFAKKKSIFLMYYSSRSRELTKSALLDSDHFPGSDSITHLHPPYCFLI